MIHSVSTPPPHTHTSQAFSKLTVHRLLHQRSGHMPCSSSSTHLFYRLLIESLSVCPSLVHHLLQPLMTCCGSRFHSNIQAVQEMTSPPRSRDLTQVLLLCPGLTVQLMMRGSSCFLILRLSNWTPNISKINAAMHQVTSEYFRAAVSRNTYSIS